MRLLEIWNYKIVTDVDCCLGIVYCLLPLSSYLNPSKTMSERRLRSRVSRPGFSDVTHHEESHQTTSDSGATTTRTTITVKRVKFQLDNSGESLDGNVRAEAIRSSVESEREGSVMSDVATMEGLRNTASQTDNGIYARLLRSASPMTYVGALDVVQEARRRFTSNTSVQRILEFLRQSDERPKTGYTYAMGRGYRENGITDPEPPNMCRYSLDHYVTRASEPAGQMSAAAGASYSRNASRTAGGTLSTSSYSQRQTSSSARSHSAFSDDENDEDFIRQRQFRSRQSSAVPEPASPFIDTMSQLSRVCRRIFTSTTTTTTSNSNQARGSESDDQEVDTTKLVTVNGRITPESRSGSGTEDSGTKSQSFLDRSYFSTRQDDSSLSQRTPRQTGFHRNRSSGLNGIYSNGHLGPSHPLGISTRTASAARSVLDTVRRRLIDIVTTTTTTITNVFTKDDYRDEERPRRSRWAACCWCLPWLLLLPLLFGLLPLIWRNSEAGAGNYTTVINQFYHGLWPSIFATERSVTPVIYQMNSTNLTREQLEHIIDWKLRELPVPKNCCDDLALIRSQIDLILNRINELQDDKISREKWEHERIVSEERTRQSIEQLRIVLTTLEQASKTPDDYVPKVIQERERFTLEDIRLMIAQMIKRYDEDKIGEPDHALESAGATVISTRCTEEYKWGHAQFSLLGIPLWTWTTSPRLAIQDDLRPGQCWAFKGDQGYLVIKLAGLVRPTSFTIDHLPKNLSPTGRIDSAPRNFSVYGLMSEQGPGVVLGDYEYLDNDQAMQNFQIQTKLEPTESFGFIELRITSNHGHPDYTCLYRFRVHGFMIQRGHF